MSCSLLLRIALPLLLMSDARAGLSTTVESSGIPSAARQHWTADNGNGTYSNPRFYEEFEDPDIIRVGEDYYLAGTTMHMNPAVQIVHSKDLVNWELVGYCLDRLDLGPAFRLEGGNVYGQGIWAPCIRHHRRHALHLLQCQWRRPPSLPLPIHPRPGTDGYPFEPADRFVEFGEKRGMFIVGHTLVWHAQTPRWVFAGEGTNAVSRDLLLQRLRDHIHTGMGRYRGRIKAWDVVNEALNEDGSLRQSPWCQIIGEGDIAKAFEFARQADPSADLRCHDYAIENERKHRGTIALARQLQAQKLPIHGLGSPMHANLDWPSAELLDSALTEFGQLGVSLSITELDVDTPLLGQHRQSAEVAANARTESDDVVNEAPQKLAARYASLFRFILKHRRNIKLVTFWGVTDATSWRRSGNPLLFDGNGQPKPAFDAVVAEALRAPVGRWTSHPSRHLRNDSSYAD